jgi:VanZ family protein
VPSGLTTPGHAVLYAILGVLLLGALLPGRATSRAAALAIVIASLYGVTDEVHQAFVPGRIPDVLDWAWDTVGAAAGVASLQVARLLLARRWALSGK